LKPIKTEEISNLLAKIKNYASFYENNLSNFLLKKIAVSISLSLSFIFNKSLLSGKYPSTFKKRMVILLFKTGNRLFCDNYRPITFS